MSWFNLHPKIKAALLASIATSVGNVWLAVQHDYPRSPWIGVVSALVPVVVGYLKSA